MRTSRALSIGLNYHLLNHTLRHTGRQLEVELTQTIRNLGRPPERRQGSDLL